MKSIKQIAEELGVSKQAISNRKHLLPPSTVKTLENGTKLINAEGEAILRAVIKPRATRATSKLPPTPPTNETTTSEILVAILQKELDIKNRQIEALTAALEQTTSSLNASHALHAGTMQKQLPTSGGNVFSRIFGKRQPKE